MPFKAAVFLCQIPHLQESIGVEPRVCCGPLLKVANLLLDRRNHNAHDRLAAGVNANGHWVSTITEDGEFIACEDADMPPLLLNHKGVLIARCPYNGEAKEGGPSPVRRCGGGRGECCCIGNCCRAGLRCSACCSDCRFCGCGSICGWIRPARAHWFL